jgi:hypothetical protein
MIKFKKEYTVYRWAINLGLLVAGLLLPLLGAVRGKKNSDRRQWHKCGEGVGDSFLVMEIACHQVIVLFSVLLMTEPYKDKSEPQRQQEPRFKMKKPYITSWTRRYGEGVEINDPSRMSSRS